MRGECWVFKLTSKHRNGTHHRTYVELLRKYSNYFSAQCTQHLSLISILMKRKTSKVAVVRQPNLFESALITFDTHTHLLINGRTKSFSRTKVKRQIKIANNLRCLNYPTSVLCSDEIRQKSANDASLLCQSTFERQTCWRKCSTRKLAIFAIVNRVILLSALTPSPQIHRLKSCTLERNTMCYGARMAWVWIKNPLFGMGNLL